MTTTTTTTMRALGLPLTGGKTADDLTELEMAMPSIERPRDILVKVMAFAGNPVDYKARNGIFGEKQVMGYDASGIVVAVGPEATLFKPGDEVFYAGDVLRQGTNAEYHVVDERIVGRKPANLTHASAAAMPLVSLTAWEALLEQMAIPQDKAANARKAILIMAGGGGVGSTAIQIAKRVLGLTVVAAASRDETAAFAKQMGADLIISGRGDLREELAAVGLADGVEYLFDTVSHTNYERYVAAVKPLGRICSITGAGGLDLGGNFMKNIVFSTELMFAKSMAGVNMESQHAILESMAALLESGEVTSTVTTVKPWSAAALREMHEALESGKSIGKMVLTVDAAAPTSASA